MHTLKNHRLVGADFQSAYGWYEDEFWLATGIESDSSIPCPRYDRALIGGLIGSGLDLSTLGTAEAIADVIKERLKG